MADTWESFYKATRALCGADSQRQRLVDAFQEIHRVATDLVPEEARAPWSELQQGMRKVQISGEQGTLQSSVDMMDDNEVRRMVECILEVYTKVTRFDERMHLSTT